MQQRQHLKRSNERAHSKKSKPNNNTSATQRQVRAANTLARAWRLWRVQRTTRRMVGIMRVLGPNTPLVVAMG
jgi:hypothetical protein